jgi:translation initiation factor IF-2
MQIEGQRVHELADELGLNRQELVDTINDLDLGFTVNNFMSRLSEAEIKELKQALESAEKAAAEPDAAEADAAAEDEEGIGPTVIRRKTESAEDDEQEAEAAGETSDEDAAAAAPEGAAVRKRSEDDEGTDEDVSEEEPAEVADVEEEEPADEAEPEEVSEEKADEEPAAQPEDEEPVEAEAGEDAEQEDQEPAAEEGDEPEEPTEQEEETDDEPPKTPEDEEPATETEDEPAEQTDSEPKRPSKETGSRAKKKEKEKEDEDGAQVLGTIDQNVVQDRLKAEGKTFEPGKKKGKNKDKSKKKSKNKNKKKDGGRGNSRVSPHRQVVEGKDLYDGKSKNRNRRRQKKKGGEKQPEITEAAEHKRNIQIEDVISVGDLAQEMGVKAGDVAMKLMQSGMNANVNTTLDYETASLVADEYGYTVENVAFDISNFYDTEEDPDETQEPRAPVITVMGHVDHGKTSLLDAVRKSDVTAEEAGGITQHIGAYQVNTGDGAVTFLDTPGHEAFTALRARGAKATDIVILVVAADDGVMPQTVEAINHAQDAGVPIVVAINKIDKPTANPDRVKQALTEYELVPEEWGGTTLYVEVSALQGTNIEGLLESVSLQAELEDLQANPNRNAQGIVIEAELDTGRGPVATVLVQRGTLKQGDIVVSGQNYGRARTMHDDRGQEVDSAGPSQPVEITGLSGVPEAGEPFFVVDEESDARAITENVEQQRRKEEMASRAKDVAAGSIEDLSAMIQEGEIKELKVILKGDVQGSVEALREAFNDLGNEEVRVQVIHSGVGAVTENDVNLAASSDTAALIVGFNVRPDRRAQEIAEEHGVQVLTHSVIYDAIDQVRNILEGLLEPITEEVILGRVEVREIFKSNQAGTIAGCYVRDGEVKRDAHARLLRENRVLYETELASLRRFDDDVKEVREGFECGISLVGYDDIKEGDEIEIFEYREVSATLN